MEKAQGVADSIEEPPLGGGLREKQRKQSHSHEQIRNWTPDCMGALNTTLPRWGIMKSLKGGASCAGVRGAPNRPARRASRRSIISSTEAA